MVLFNLLINYIKSVQTPDPGNRSLPFRRECLQYVVVTYHNRRSAYQQGRGSNHDIEKYELLVDAKFDNN